MRLDEFGSLSLSLIPPRRKKNERLPRRVNRACSRQTNLLLIGFSFFFFFLFLFFLPILFPPQTFIRIALPPFFCITGAINLRLSAMFQRTADLSEKTTGWSRRVAFPQVPLATRLRRWSIFPTQCKNLAVFGSTPRQTSFLLDLYTGDVNRAPYSSIV